MGLNNEPYISNKEIEDATLNLISDFEKKFNTKVNGPRVPIDQIMSAHLDIEYEPADIIGETHKTNCLARFLVRPDGQMRVEIEKTLWPDENPLNLGRFNFTLAHETMHFVLHKHVLFEHLEETPLITGNRRQVVLCRSSKKDRRELQADIGAGYLLMPTQFILNEWRNQFGENAGPQNIHDEIMEKAKQQGKDPRDVRDPISIEFANIFEVSPYAMQIRLRNMHLLEVEEAQPTLF